MKDLKQNHNQKNNLQSLLIEFLNGKTLESKSLSQFLPFLIYLSLLVMFYINNSYKTERYVREISSIEKQLKDLRSEHITTKSQLMYVSKQTEVEKLVNEKGLKLTKDQPFVLKK
jgi:cell division protein FtsL